MLSAQCSVLCDDVQRTRFGQGIAAPNGVREDEMKSQKSQFRIGFHFTFSPSAGLRDPGWPRIPDRKCQVEANTKLRFLGFPESIWKSTKSLGYIPTPGISMIFNGLLVPARDQVRGARFRTL